jgi:hypothetical protein
LLLAWFLYWRKAIGTAAGLRLAPAVSALLVCGALFLAFRATMSWRMPDSRLNDLLQLGSERVPHLEDINTVAFRLEMYQKTLSQLSQRGPLKLVVGSGTSSGAELAFTWEEDLPTGVDPNNTIHSAVLRVLYEWGLVGLALGIILTSLLISSAWGSAVHEGLHGALAVAGMFPAVLVLLLVGDPLPGPASPMGMGLLLVLTHGLRCGCPTRVSRPPMVPRVRASGATA